MNNPFLVGFFTKLLPAGIYNKFLLVIYGKDLYK